MSLRYPRWLVRLASGWMVPLACLAALAGEPRLEFPKTLPETAGEAFAMASRPERLVAEINPQKEIELITERYPDGSVKIERQVTQDLAGNYLNHGSFTEYDQHGKILRAGQFQGGKQQGKWTRYFEAGQHSLFSGDLDKQFSGSFVSEATFVDGALHGTWFIQTRAGQRIVEWPFEHGVRHGKSSWWHPTGELRRQMTYKQGEPDGEVLEWGADGQLVNRTTFINCRQLVHEVKWHRPGQKSYEGNYLVLPSTTVTAYDWWNGTVQVEPVTNVGPKQKHGLWTGWYPNGLKKVTGVYEFDVPKGKFTWWYENGQKQAEGEYRNGQQHGQWLTWHTNGQKESDGEYVAGVLTGKWTRWQADGKIVEVFDTSLENRLDSQPAPPAVLQPRPLRPGSEPSLKSAEMPEQKQPVQPT